MANEVGQINVEISYKIIELFSAGLYSSPNKAFEELVCNSYDAFADTVSIYISPDLNSDNAYIMVCDNGEGINTQEFHDLWKIGESKKRDDPDRDKRRLQIGQFGIGKLSTYILSRKLTHISKKDGKFLKTTMDYELIHGDTKELILPEYELTEEEARDYLNAYCVRDGKSLVDFKLFGSNSMPSWTICLLTDLKTKASEIQVGRLKWILSTALPLVPNAFNMYLNGEAIESSKTKIPVLHEWIIGENDITANELDFVEAGFDSENRQHYIDLETLPHITGKCILYEQSLLGGKAADNGRSHGIFLFIRGRLVNLDDPLLGMEPFSHGPFNHCQIIINANGLDNNLTSTREAVKDSIPLKQLKEYIKKKFNNEIRKYYFDFTSKQEEKKTVAYRLSQASYSTSHKPIVSFVKSYYEGKIANPLLIAKPTIGEEELQTLYSGKDGYINAIEKVNWDVLGSGNPIGRLNLEKRELTINMLHPFVANYSDSYKNRTPLENIVITEVLTEAFLYELGLDDTLTNAVIRRRDKTLRDLAFADKEGIPAVAQMLHDALSNPIGLEDAVYRSLLALGFEVSKIGGTGTPDGIATAALGYMSEDNQRAYTLTYDAKSTSKNRIQAGTAKLSGLKRHQSDYNATYCLEVAIGYEGQDDPESAISKEAIEQKVTVMKASDLALLLLYSIPNHLGLTKLRELFETCYSPIQVSKWVKDFVEDVPEQAPYYEIIETIYDLQKTDNEPPIVQVIRMKLNERMGKNYSSSEITTHLTAIENIIPGQFHFDGAFAWVDVAPDIVKSHISQAINSTPLEMRNIYSAIFQ